MIQCSSQLSTHPNLKSDRHIWQYNLENNKERELFLQILQRGKELRNKSILMISYCETSLNFLSMSTKRSKYCLLHFIHRWIYFYKKPNKNWRIVTGGQLKIRIQLESNFQSRFLINVWYNWGPWTMYFKNHLSGIV